MVKMLKLLLQRLGVYNTIRYSEFYFKVLKYKNPNYIKALNEDHEFYRKALGNSISLVFDVGSNNGDKTWAFRQMAKKVVSIEPDETCFKALCARYRRDKGVYLENVALGEQEGVGTFFLEEYGSAYNTLNEKHRDWLVSTHKQIIREVLVKVSTLDNMIIKYGIPDFLKIDVEGGELSVFNGLSYTVPVICFEANLPHFRAESLRIIERLRVNNAARFNLRLKNNFVFPSHQTAEEIIGILTLNHEVSYDIFVFNAEYGFAPI